MEKYGGRGGGNPAIAQIGGIEGKNIGFLLKKFKELIKIELIKE